MMNNKAFYDFIEKEIIDLTRKHSIIEKQLVKFPVGTLKICSRTSNNSSYYHCYKEGELTIKKYIPKRKDFSLATALANKQYLEKIDQTITKQIKALTKLKSTYSPTELEEIYTSMSPERQALVTPITGTADMNAQKWNETPYNKSTAFPERLIFKSDKGDMVRSKSEVIIANYLHSHSDKIFYRYENPLELTQPRPITIYPDFTIISRSTGKIVYLEHCGMLDDDEYADAYVNKMNTYILNGIIPGRDVILTAETSRRPLIIESLWAQLEAILQ